MNDFEHGPKLEQPRLITRMLGHLGLVWGEGMSEFGLRHVGMGLPLHRRSTLEASQAAARGMLAIAEEIQSRRPEGGEV